jgi:hypothetical protein
VFACLHLLASFSAAVPCRSGKSASATLFFAFGCVRYRNIATSHLRLLRWLVFLVAGAIVGFAVCPRIAAL